MNNALRSTNEELSAAYRAEEEAKMLINSIIPIDARWVANLNNLEAQSEPTSTAQPTSTASTASTASTIPTTQSSSTAQPTQTQPTSTAQPTQTQPTSTAQPTSTTQSTQSTSTTAPTRELVFPRLAIVGGNPSRQLFADMWRERLFQSAIMPDSRLANRSTFPDRRLSTYYLEIMDLWFKLLMNSRNIQTSEIARFYDVIFLRYQLKMPLVLTPQQFAQLLALFDIPIDDETPEITEIRSKLKVIAQRIRNRSLTTFIKCWDDSRCECTACQNY